MMSGISLVFHSTTFAIAMPIQVVMNSIVEFAGECGICDQNGQEHDIPGAGTDAVAPLSLEGWHTICTVIWQHRHRY